MRAAHRLILHSKNSGLPHTIPMKLSGTCGSVSVRLIPAPRGTGLVAAPASKKILAMAGLEDCYSTTRGHSRTTGNFITAVFNAVSASYGSVHKSRWGEVSRAEKLTGRCCAQVRLPLARVMEAHGAISASSFHFWTPKVVESRKFHSLIIFRTGLLESAVPGAHRLPRQGGRVGQGRRCLLGTRHDTAVLQVDGGPPPRSGASTLADYRVPA